MKKSTKKANICKMVKLLCGRIFIPNNPNTRRGYTWKSSKKSGEQRCHVEQKIELCMLTAWKHHIYKYFMFASIIFGVFPGRFFFCCWFVRIALQFYSFELFYGTFFCPTMEIPRFPSLFHHSSCSCTNGDTFVDTKCIYDNGSLWIIAKMYG